LHVLPELPVSILQRDYLMERTKYFVKKQTFKGGWYAFSVVFKGDDGDYYTVRGLEKVLTENAAIERAEELEGKLVVSEEYL